MARKYLPARTSTISERVGDDGAHQPAPDAASPRAACHDQGVDATKVGGGAAVGLGADIVEVLGGGEPTGRAGAAHMADQETSDLVPSPRLRVMGMQEGLYRRRQRIRKG